MQALPQCSATVYLTDSSKKSRERLINILGRFSVDNKSFSEGQTTFDIKGQSLQAIVDEIVIPLKELMNPDRRSCFFYVGEGGAVSTVLIVNGKIHQS